MVKILTAFVINLVAIYASVVFGPLKARRRVCMVNSPTPALFLPLSRLSSLPFLRFVLLFVAFTW